MIDDQYDDQYVDELILSTPQIVAWT